MPIPSFQQFNESYTRKYISITYDGATQTKLRAWCMENGFNLGVKWDGTLQNIGEFQFHTTIFHSINPVFLKNGDKEIFGKAFGKGFKLLGENHDIPVLMLESHDIQQVRWHFEQLGFEDEWPTYVPHVSLSYDRSVSYDLHDLEVPDFELKFNRVSIQDI